MKYINTNTETIERKGLKFPAGEAVEIPPCLFAPGDFAYIQTKGAVVVDPKAEGPKPKAAQISDDPEPVGTKPKKAKGRNWADR